MKPEIQFEDDQVLIRLPKCLLVFSQREWIEAIRRGKLHKKANQEIRRQKVRELKTGTGLIDYAITKRIKEAFTNL